MTTKECETAGRARFGGMIQDLLRTVARDDGQRTHQVVRLHEPLPAWAERCHTGRFFVDDKGCGALPEGLEGEESRLLAVRHLETSGGVGQGRGRIVLHLHGAHHDELLRLGPARFQNAASPERSHHYEARE